MCNKKGKNILGTKLISCSHDPITGFYRDGYCNFFENDAGEHTVCAELTNKFLIFSKQMGNDLITPRPEFDFFGLKEGDRWCICANRWLEALEFDFAPKIYLESTHISFLNKIKFEDLKEHSVELKNLN